MFIKKSKISPAIEFAQMRLNRVRGRVNASKSPEKRDIVTIEDFEGFVNELSQIAEIVDNALESSNVEANVGNALFVQSLQMLNDISRLRGRVHSMAARGASW